MISLFIASASFGQLGIFRFFFKITSQDFTILCPPSKLISVWREDVFDEARVLAMASIPVASFSASKIHDHLKSKHGFDESSNGEQYSKMFRQNVFGIDKVIQNYNSKLMNSIWGQYNLYAAHAFQKNNESSSPIADIFSVPQVKNLWDMRAAH